MANFKKLLEQLCEGYKIIRTKPNGEEDDFAGGFDTKEAVEKELKACLAHNLHTKHKQQFRIVKK